MSGGAEPAKTKLGLEALDAALLSAGAADESLVDLRVGRGYASASVRAPRVRGPHPV